MAEDPLEQIRAAMSEVYGSRSFAEAISQAFGRPMVLGLDMARMPDVSIGYRVRADGTLEILEVEPVSAANLPLEAAGDFDSKAGDEA